MGTHAVHFLTEVERIHDQLRRAFAGEAWHGPSVLESFEGVTAEQAAAKPMANVHSIWEIVLHITFWEDGIRRRLRGETVEAPPPQDWPAVGETSEQAWHRVKELLKQGHSALEKDVAKLTDARLADTIPGRDHSVYFALHGIIQHDLYHAGQIAVLKKAADKQS